MQITIHFEPSRPVDVTVLHGWHPQRSPWHLDGTRNADGTFSFILEHDVEDPREIRFKYLFPRAGDRWEPDDFVRRIPTRETSEIWTFDYTPRCLRSDPYTTPAPDTITLNVVTRRRFSGGFLYVWSAGGGESEVIAQGARDEQHQLSLFTVARRPWMERGFHFKLVSADEKYEPDRHNRVWKPVDGNRVWLKSGRLDLAAVPLGLQAVPIELVYPKSLDQAPRLVIQDDVDDFSDTLEPSAQEDLDELFVVARFEVRLYLDALYHTRVSAPEGQSILWQCPIRLLEGTPPGTSIAVAGGDRWLESRPGRTARVEYVLHPNPGTTFDQEVPWDIGIGASAAHETVVASRRVNGTWSAAFRVFPELAHWMRLNPAGGREYRPDGPFDSRREFSAPAGGPSILRSIDAVAGVTTGGIVEFEDVDTSTRRALMEAAFAPEMVSAGVFDPWEMPHGAVAWNGEVWFVLRAPYAAQAELLILNEDDQNQPQRVTTVFPMRLTPDLRYLWCRLPAAAVAHGAHYRFLLNNVVELVDPATRWAHDPGRLWCRPGEGKEGPWARYVDMQRIRNAFAGSPWRTMGWEALVIYELHPRRFTRRNNVQSDFDQIKAELTPSGYLNRLGVTALELLPVHEFPRAQSWGYNPSLFFAVDSTYGGPEEFAQLVRAVHDSGRALLLDVVYNHLNESPLETLALDVYVSGETNWGNMVHYAHPACMEFFRQAFLYLWHAYHLDGFRFDATEAIVNGHEPNGYILREPGNGKGWEFLLALRRAVRRAADAEQQPWPYLVAENDPNNWGMSDARSGPVMDGQWHFEHHYRLNDAARNNDDKADAIRAAMDWPHSELRPFFEATRFGESHDSTSAQEGWKQRIVRHEPYGFGRRMAKAVAAAVILAKGVPMLFMGQEAGEDLPFYFGMDDLSDPSRYLRLDVYQQSGEMNRILTWSRHLLGLRNNPDNGLRGDDDQRVRNTPKTLTFSRNGGRFFVVIGLGTWYTEQNLGVLGLPWGAVYKEIFNSTWPAYRMDDEPRHYNGGYDAHLLASNNLNLPSIGAVILQRR